MLYCYISMAPTSLWLDDIFFRRWYLTFDIIIVRGNIPALTLFSKNVSSVFGGHASMPESTVPLLLRGSHHTAGKVRLIAILIITALLHVR